MPIKSNLQVPISAGLCHCQLNGLSLRPKSPAWAAARADAHIDKAHGAAQDRVSAVTEVQGWLLSTGG